MITSRFKNILRVSLALMVFLPLVSAQGSTAELAMNADPHPRPAAIPLASSTPFDDKQVTLGTTGNDRIVQYGRGGNDTQYAAGLDNTDWLAQYGGRGDDSQKWHRGRCLP